MEKRHNEKRPRYLLGWLLAFLALNAFGGGYYGMRGAETVPVEWLKGIFPDYFIPGLILFVCVGGPALLASIAVFRQHRLAHKAVMVCGIITLLWLVVQVAIIGYASWMQPATAILCVVILLLNRKWSPEVA